jgi:hypothetical protein
VVVLLALIPGVRTGVVDAINNLGPKPTQTPTYTVPDPTTRNAPLVIPKTTHDVAPPSTYETPTTSRYVAPPPPTTTRFDPGTLNDARTDRTPFTVNALMPDTFVNDLGVKYRNVAGGNKVCVQANMSRNVQAVLGGYGCAEMVTGVYLATDNRVLVSVEVYAFANDSTAVKVAQALNADSAADYGFWCPTNGVGSTVCTQQNYHSGLGYRSLSQKHRYVITAVSVYVNLTRDPSVQPWLSSAVKQAVTDVGPQH